MIVRLFRSQGRAYKTPFKELTLLRNEMRLLLNLCHGAKDGCPIIEMGKK